MLKSLFVFGMMVSVTGNAAVDPNTVVATVNGQPVYFFELDQKFKQSQLVLASDKVTKEEVLDQIIDRRLGIERAYKSGLEKDPVVKEKMEDVLYHAMVSKDLEPLLKDIRVEDKEVGEYYKNNPEYRTAHILFKVPVIGEELVSNKAKKEIEVVYKEVLASPQKFSEIANKYTQGSSAPNGGDIGFQPKARLDSNYYSAIKGQKIGFISQPVKTQFGWHIIKVLGVKEFKDINMDFYKKFLYDQKRDAIIKEYYGRQRTGANIKTEKKFLN